MRRGNIPQPLPAIGGGADLLTERFQTRFEAAELLPPESEEMTEFLVARWSVPKQTAAQIAVGSGGCVRAALADRLSSSGQRSLRIALGLEGVQISFAAPAWM